MRFPLRSEQPTLDALCAKCHGTGTLEASGVRGFEFAMPCPNCAREHTPTVPAPPSLDPVTHEVWLELLRNFTDLSAIERDLVLSIARCLRSAPLTDVSGPVHWRLEARDVVGDGPSNFRSGGGVK